MTILDRIFFWYLYPKCAYFMTTVNYKLYPNQQTYQLAWLNGLNTGCMQSKQRIDKNRKTKKNVSTISNYVIMTISKQWNTCIHLCKYMTIYIDIQNKWKNEKDRDSENVMDIELNATITTTTKFQWLIHLIKNCNNYVPLILFDY